LLRQGQRPAEAAVAADHDQALDAAAPQHGGGLRPARRVEELLGARRAEDRAAALDDVRDVPGVQLDDVVLDEALVPAVDARDAGRLVRVGAGGGVAAGRGAARRVPDSAYEAAGATVGRREELLAGADLLLTVQPPSLEVVGSLRPGAVTAGFVDPFFNHELVRALARGRVSALCVELIPRTTYAQKMDALSSQASLAGYAAVVVAARHSHKAFPMMSTPAGTIAPARVFVVGAGVAGLQAIATAKR